MKKSVTIFTVLILVLSMSVGSFAAENKNTRGNSSASQGVLNMTMAAFMEDGQNRAEVNGDNPVKAERLAFKAMFSEEFSQLEGLRAECKTNWTTIKSLNEEIKVRTNELRKDIKALDKDAAIAGLQHLNTETAGIREDIDTIRADIRLLQESKKAEWSKFKTAVKAKNSVAAQAAIEKILDLKGQIIDIQNDEDDTDSSKNMIQLKTDLLNILNSFVVQAPVLDSQTL